MKMGMTVDSYKMIRALLNRYQCNDPYQRTERHNQIMKIISDNDLTEETDVIRVDVTSKGLTVWIIANDCFNRVQSYFEIPIHFDPRCML